MSWVRSAGRSAEVWWCERRKEQPLGERRITQIPVPGSSGETPTGVLQFQDDWPGLFVWGDDAIALMWAIEQLAARLAGNEDVVVASALSRLTKIYNIIDQDVFVC